MPRYENTRNGSNKFWEIEINGNWFATRWGAIGTQGQRKIKTFANPTIARAEYNKLIISKLRKGYTEVSLAPIVVSHNLTFETKPTPKYKIGDIVYPKKPKNVSQWPTWTSVMDNYHCRKCEIVEYSMDEPHVFVYKARAVDSHSRIEYSFREEWLTTDEKGVNLSPSQKDETRQDRIIKRILLED